MKIRRLLVAIGLVGAGLGGAVVAAPFSDARWRVGLRPGFAWVIESWPTVLTCGFVLLSSGLILAAAALTKTRAAWLTRVFGGLGLVAIAGGAILCPAVGSRYPTYVVEPLGDGSALLLRSDSKPEAAIYRDGVVKSRTELECDAPLTIRRSRRPGRLLVTGRDGVVGALVDKPAGNITSDPAALPPLEELKTEFGPGIRLDEP